MTPAQTRAARALLNWTQDQLAAQTVTPLSLIVEFEAERRPPPGDAVARLVSALGGAGVVLVPEDGGGAGVRFRRPTSLRAEGIRPEDLNSSNDD